MVLAAVTIYYTLINIYITNNFFIYLCNYGNITVKNYHKSKSYHNYLYRINLRVYACIIDLAKYYH